jgi:hypothetical protein
MAKPQNDQSWFKKEMAARLAKKQALPFNTKRVVPVVTKKKLK